MIKRTDEEVKAYVDGYNACYEKFVEILLGRNGVNTAIRKMEMLKTAVNNVLLSDGSNLSTPESDSSNLRSRERKEWTLFLDLDDAVKVAVYHFGADQEIAKQEFEQKCYISNDQYAIGFFNGLEAAKKAIEKEMEGE